MLFGAYNRGHDHFDLVGQGCVQDFAIGIQGRYWSPVLNATEIPFLGKQYEDSSPAADW